MTSQTRINILFVAVLLALLIGVTTLILGGPDQREIAGGIAGLSAISIILLAPVFFDD